MSGTHVFYNGVLLRDCELLAFEQLIEKDKSGTDPLYSRFRISVASRLVSMTSDTLDPSHTPHLSTIAPPLPEANVMVDRLAQIQERLQEFRKDFWMAINASTFNTRADAQAAPANDTTNNDPYRIVLAATGLLEDGSQTGKVGGYYIGKDTNIDRDSVIDADNGPKTSNVKVVKIDGGRAMRVQFSIDVCRCVCNPNIFDSTTPPVRDAAKVEGVISNRWSVQETIDDNWKTSFAIEGVLVVSDQRYKPDAMRLMTSQHLIPYAKLAGREFFVSEDGLTLRYRYSMQERGAAPPPLVVDWEGTYTEKSDQSAITTSVLNVKVKGTVTPPNGWALSQYKSYMVDVLWKLIQARISLSASNPGKLPGFDLKTTIIKDLTIMESMHSPEVGMNLIVQHSADPMFFDYNMRLTNIGRDLTFANYDPKWWPIPSAYTWDTETMRAERSNLGSVYDGYYQSPCSEWHGKPRGILIEDAATRVGDQVYVYSGISTPPVLTNYIQFPTYTPGGGPPELFNWSNDQLKGACYLTVEADNQHTRDAGVMVLPLSKSRSGVLGSESLVTIPVHAGVNTRRFTMVCKRENDWPFVPAPKDKIQASTGDVVETLVKSSIVPEAPKLGADGRTFTYTVHCQFDYAASRAPTDLKVPRDPRVKAISDAGSGGLITSDQLLPIAYLYDYSGKIEATGPA